MYRHKTTFFLSTFIFLSVSIIDFGRVVCVYVYLNLYPLSYICNVVWTRLTTLLFLISFPSSFSRTVACVYNLLILLFFSSFLISVSSYSTTHFPSLSQFSYFFFLSPVQQSAIPHIVLSSLHLSISLSFFLYFLFSFYLSLVLSPSHLSYHYLFSIPVVPLSLIFLLLLTSIVT
jgi:hypothetical protein